MKENITIIIGDTPKNITGEYHVLTGEAYGDFSQNTDINPFINVFREYLLNKGFDRDLVNLCIGYSGLVDPLRDIQKAMEDLKERVGYMINQEVM